MMDVFTLKVVAGTFFIGVVVGWAFGWIGCDIFLEIKHANRS